IVHCKLGDYRRAIQDLGQAMELNPQDAQVRYHRGLVRIELGDYRGAIDDLTKLLQSNPENRDVLIHRGNAYIQMGDYRQAIEDYSRVITLKPNDAQSYRYRATAREKFEDLRGAFEDYQQAANLYFDQQDWTNYRKLLDKLKQLQPLQLTEGSSNRESQAPSNIKPSRELQQRLLRLVGGQSDIATRLLDLAKGKYPGMPEKWYWEKVIKDLER
ncbi:MAG: tetratricopeptide repeat protein, partial [Moorea sp. SIO3E2]|nr:tetratricopeptide repeat protein [Moorena sp. SIO3E2]